MTPVMGAQHGMLATIEPRAFCSSEYHTFVCVCRQIAWLIPVMSFSTLTGLALDYDVFIISRIVRLVVQRSGTTLDVAGPS